MPPRQPTLPIFERAAFNMRDASLYAAISRNGLYRKIATGEIKSTLVGGRRLVMRESLDTLLKLKP